MTQADFATPMKIPAFPDTADSSFPVESRTRFHCRCGQRLHAPLAARGKRARCPKCSMQFTVPGVTYIGSQGSAILKALRSA